MLPIVFNFNASRFDRQMEATALKAGYLLADHPIIAGTTPDEINLRRILNTLPIIRKLEMLIGLYKNNPEVQDVFKHLHQSMKRVVQIKHKQKELLAVQKQAEQNILKCWGPALTHMENSFDSHGFGVVRMLQDEQTFYFLPINVNPEDGTDHTITASEIMQRLLFSDDGADSEINNPTPELFCLGDEFFKDEYAKPLILTATDKEANRMDSIYLEHCFTLPHINDLTALELRQVRGQLSHTGNAFRKATDSWCDSCYNEEEPLQRLNVFTNEVLPAAKLLQPAIDSNETLQLCRRQYSRHPEVKVWMGEIPVLQLWDYYRHFNALNDATWQKLQNVKNDTAYKGQRWPFMVLKTGNQLLPDEPVEEIKASKKFLSVD